MVFFVAGEIIIRLIKTTEEKPPPYNTAEKDAKLGWKPKENYDFEGVMKDFKGQEYPLKLTTTANGFRQFATLSKDTLPSILFIGDSYVQSVEVSDDKTFYALLEDQLPAKIYAFGMAGYGNLQEYMILDEYLDKIQPDITVVQLCANDFIDNYPPLELASNYKVGLRRPYLEADGSISYQTPIPQIERNIQWSSFLSFLYDKWKIIKEKNQDKAPSAEELISSQAFDYPHYATSVDLTQQILAKIKDRAAGKTKLVIMLADYWEPQIFQFREICGALGLPLLETQVHRINEAKGKETVFSQDGYHWNERGHEIVAKALEIQLNDVLDW